MILNIQALNFENNIVSVSDLNSKFTTNRIIDLRSSATAWCQWHVYAHVHSVFVVNWLYKSFFLKIKSLIGLSSLLWFLYLMFLLLPYSITIMRTRICIIMLMEYWYYMQCPSSKAQLTSMFIRHGTDNDVFLLLKDRVLYFKTIFKCSCFKSLGMYTIIHACIGYYNANIYVWR